MQAAKSFAQFWSQIHYCIRDLLHFSYHVCTCHCAVSVLSSEDNSQVWFAAFTIY